MIFIVCVKQIYEEYKYTFAIFLYEKVVIFLCRHDKPTGIRVFEWVILRSKDKISNAWPSNIIE
jgi:hypothetical protein